MGGRDGRFLPHAADAHKKCHDGVCLLQKFPRLAKRLLFLSFQIKNHRHLLCIKVSTYMALG